MHLISWWTIGSNICRVPVQIPANTFRIRMMDYERFISKRASRRVRNQTSGVSSMIDDSEKKGADFRRFDAGLPSFTTFPVTNIAFTLGGKTLDLSGKLLHQTLQYNTFGLRECQEAAYDIILRTHTPPRWHSLADQGRAEVNLTTGGTSLFSVFDLLLNEGNYVLVGETLAADKVSQVMNLGGKPLPVAMDDEGMDPESLRQLLSRWKPEDAQDPDSDIPKLLVCVPNHHNPTGAMLSEPRRREIYELARRYNLIIYEDDSLSFLNYQQDLSRPSFLSMDVDGRVVHASSLSGIMAPGFRLGWICMPQTLTDNYKNQTSTLVAGMFAFPAAAFAVMYKDWEFEGYDQYNKRVTAFYKGQRDSLITSMTKRLSGFVEWIVPQTGYFVWATVSNPDMKTEELFPKFVADSKMSFIRGSSYRCDGNKGSQVYIRLSFSKCSAHDMDEGIMKLKNIMSEAQNGPQEHA